MYHDLPRTARFWSFLLASRPRSCGDDPQESMSLRRTPALRQLSPEARGTPRPATRATAPQTELLLRSRRLQEESDTSVGSLPRPKGLPRRHRHRHQRHAARADTTPSPRAFHDASVPTGRTIARWQVFWREHFPQTPFWKVARAHLVPVVEIVSLPYSLVDAFLHRHPRCRGWTLLLRFLSPITVPGGLQIEVSR